jgi:hypothetical protein
MNTVLAMVHPHSFIIDCISLTGFLHKLQILLGLNSARIVKLEVGERLPLSSSP